jgi:carbon storage regulator
MLVIRRRVGETLLIGPDVEIEVLESGSSQVKLGIRAPRSVGVVRKEIRVVGDQNHAAARAIPKTIQKPRSQSDKPRVRSTGKGFPGAQSKERNSGICN